MNSHRNWRRAAKERDAALWARMDGQITVAQWMMSALPPKQGWEAALRKAEAAVKSQASGTTTEDALKDVERALSPFAKAAKEFKVMCVGHAHIDMNWMWGWPETVMSTIDTFRSVLTLLEEFPDFKFTQSQASVYEIVRKFAPELLGRIAARIGEGRWEVAASHWVENDMNMSSGEALVRHLLQTRAYMKNHFGLSPEDVSVCWEPDTFGHCATEPNCFARAGIRHVYMHRPGHEHQPAPEAFWWEGTDGSRVLVRNDQRRGYNCAIDPQTIIGVMEAMHKWHGIKTSQLVYGVGDHGGGPTRRDLLMFAEMASWPVFPKIEFSTSRAFFLELEKLADVLPTIRGELNVEFAGCYTTQALIKRDNRIGEGRMLDVETATAWATATGTNTYRQADFKAQLDENWQRILFAQFHDILPGSCVRDTRAHCHGEFQNAMAFTESTTARTLRAIAARVNTSSIPGEMEILPPPPALFTLDASGQGAGLGAFEGAFSMTHGHGVSADRPFVVFNTTAVARSENLTIRLWDKHYQETVGFFRSRRFAAFDASGKPLSVQYLGDGTELCHSFQTYCVRVCVPAMGYSTIVFRDAGLVKGETAPKTSTDNAHLMTSAHHCEYATRDRAVIGMENDKVTVRFDTQTGRIVSMYDKEAKCEMLDPAVGVGLEYAIEQPGPMSAWQIYPQRKVNTPLVAYIRGTQDGPNFAAVEMEYAIGNSTVKVVCKLAAGEAAVMIETSAKWVERGTSSTGIPNLRLAVGTALNNSSAVYEIPFGTVGRNVKDDREVPSQRWALIEPQCGPNSMLICNDCKYGHAMDGDTMRINLIRSPYEPDPLPDVGLHVSAFAMSIVPRGIDHAQATYAGQVFNHPLFAVGTESHEGDLATESSMLECTGDGIVLDSLKEAEDGDGFILRLHNAGDKASDATVRMGTLPGKLKSVQCVDLLERPVAGEKATLRGQIIKTKLAPGAISTLRIRFQEL